MVKIIKPVAIRENRYTGIAIHPLYLVAKRQRAPDIFNRLLIQYCLYSRGFLFKIRCTFAGIRPVPVFRRRPPLSPVIPAAYQRPNCFADPSWCMRAWQNSYAIGLFDKWLYYFLRPGIFRTYSSCFYRPMDVKYIFEYAQGQLSGGHWQANPVGPPPLSFYTLQCPAQYIRWLLILGLEILRNTPIVLSWHYFGSQEPDLKAGLSSPTRKNDTLKILSNFQR